MTEPVDRTKVCLTDGSPVTPDHKVLLHNGQQKGYVVLTVEERKKGFVRPVRESYQHVGPAGPQFPLRKLTMEEQGRYATCGYVRFEQYPEEMSPKTGRFWTQDQLDRVGQGCQGITKMAIALAETYARDPRFYSATYCAICGMHLPVDEFVWAGSKDKVGS